MTSRSARTDQWCPGEPFGISERIAVSLGDGYIRTNAGEDGMWNKIRVTAMVASLLAGTAAIAYAQSSSTLGTGGSTAGGSSTSTTLGTGGSAAGTGKRMGSSSTLGTGGSTAGERERSGSSSTLGTAGSSAGNSPGMEHRNMRGRGHHRHHGNRG